MKMAVRFKFSAVRQGHWYEYLARFALGGIVTRCSGRRGGLMGSSSGRIVFGVSRDLLRERDAYRKT